MAKKRKTDDDFQKTAKRNQEAASRSAGIRVDTQTPFNRQRTDKGYPVYLTTAPLRHSKSVGPAPQRNIKKVFTGGKYGEFENPPMLAMKSARREILDKIAREGGKAQQRFLASEKNKSGRNTAKNAKRRER